MEHFSRLDGRVAIVAGANSGIGRGIAECMAAAGAKVVVAGRTETRNAAVVEAIRAIGGEAVAIRADMMVEEDIVGLVRQTVAAYGRVDICVANSGGSEAGVKPFTEMDTKMWRDVVWLNLDSVFILYREAVKQMDAQGGGGVLIGISSLASLRSTGSAFHYAAAKAGVNALAMSLSYDLGRRGIRIHSIAPGFIESAQTASLMNNPAILAGIESRIPVGRMGIPAEVGALARFLASDEAAFLTGQTYVIDGGQSPRLVSDLAAAPR